jgi:hypothetical protein
MQCAETQYATKRTLTAPSATRRDGHRSRDVVLMVVHNQAQGPVEKVFDKFTEPGFTTDKSFRATNDVVSIGKKTGYVCGRVGSYVEDVPDIFG